MVMKMIDKNRAVDLARSLNARMNQKIEAKRIHGYMVGSIQSCLAHRRQRVELKECYSDHCTPAEV